MPNYEECRRKADECVTWAAAADDDEERRIYLEIATCWLRLAEKAPDRPDRERRP
jgi:hypothetical protein